MLIASAAVSMASDSAAAWLATGDRHRIDVGESRGGGRGVEAGITKPLLGEAGDDRYDAKDCPYCRAGRSSNGF